MRAHRAVKMILDRFAELEALWQTVLLAFERVDDRATRVRAGDVAAFVAERQGVENGPWFRRDVAEACKRAGVRRVRRDGVSWYRGMRAR